jgi:glycosyltransferase involved in cell wall biosynthesis
MRDGCYDIVHSHNWATMLYGVVAARLARVPVVLHGEHGLNADDRQGISFKREMVATVIAHMATRIVAVNDFIKEQSQERWKLKPSRVVNIPNGVDLTRFSPNPRTRMANDELIIGTVARFDPIKNIRCIICGFDLFRRANPSRKSCLVLVGDGPLMKELREFASSLSCAPDIQFPGETNNPEELYSRFDIYINGSFSEGMSNTILEGMACGIPVIASDVPGNRAWLESDINAIFFQSDNAQELSHKLTTLADDPARMKKMGDENRRRAQLSYDNREFILRYDQLYQQLLKE